MRRARWLLSSLVGGVIFFSPLVRAAEPAIPELRSPVQDDANILSAHARDSLEDLLRQMHEGGGSQLSVLTVDSLQGLPIEMYSIKVVEKWKLGDAKKDNGVLFLIAMRDRKLRIEVGQGLEGDLTDLRSKRIIDEITPIMRAGDYDRAITTGVVEILRTTDPKAFDRWSIGQSGYGAEPQVANGVPSRPASLLDRLKGLLFLPVLILFILLQIFRPRRRSFFGGGWGGGSGFGGGGGWSGGGGGFSGGGASGSW